MMNRSDCIAFLLLAAFFIGDYAIGEQTTQHIERDVEAVLARSQTPGATILALRNGKPIFRHAFGYRDLERRLPATMDTHFELGSITKQFTAAAILQLRDSGKLDIDAKVSTYLPDVPHASEITLRQLLTHSSGVADYFGLLPDEELSKPTTFDGIMKLAAEKPLDYPPGSRATYSNTGYMILGRLIELESHQSYRDYVKSHLLAPAGMTQTFTIDVEASVPLMAKGYRRVKGKREPGLTIDESYSGPAGDLVSTVADVEKWNQALSGGKIVSKADYALMSSPQFLTGGKETGYGFGFFVDRVNDQPRIGHTGSTFGFTAANFYFPAQKLRIIVLTNNVGKPEPGETLANAVFDDLYPIYALAARQQALGADPAVTAKAKSAFECLQQGTADDGVFSESLKEKLKNGLAARFATVVEPYGPSTSIIFKGDRTAGDKRWFDYRLEFGPGSFVTFSVALDAQGKVTSFGFDNL
jgi:CubicO group peptidase (beta-lactamase class C family)